MGELEPRRIQFSEELQGDRAVFFKAFRDKGIEGNVSKHALAPYRSGRSKTWPKTKCFIEIDVCGCRDGPGSETGALRGRVHDKPTKAS